MDTVIERQNTKTYYRSKIYVTACFLHAGHIDPVFVRYTLLPVFWNVRIRNHLFIFIMNVNRLELAGILASIVLVILAGVFAFSQKAYAADDPCDLPGMGMFGCEDNNGGVKVPVDPCEITPCDSDEPSLGEEITCAVYEELIAQGEPIPQGFDASGCDGNEGGGGDTPACADGVDNDGDSLVDSADPGCADSNDDDETNSTDGGGGSSNPACSDGSDNDGDSKVDMDDPGCSEANDTDEADPSSGGSGNSGGGGDGGGGSVAGSATSTPESCDKYLTAFIKFGGKNDEEQVKRLQHVLLWFEGANIEESGVYDEKTLGAVHAFQTKYWDTILAPWNIKQSTGFVYLTTRKKVNEIYCKNEVMFPLSSEENEVIENTKKAYTTVTAKPEKPTEKPTTTPEVEDEVDAEEATTPTASESATKRSGWGSVGNFLRRLFNRGN